MDVHNTIGGSLQISTEVIAKIARLAALEVDGVSDVATGTSQNVRSLLGRTGLQKPVTVVMEDGSRRAAACIGGMLSVMNGTCRLLATTWEWKEDIDQPRAEKAKKHAEEMLAKGGLTDKEYKIVEAKLQRALVRLSVKS